MRTASRVSAAVAAVRRRGGVAMSSLLRESGHPRHAIADAVAAGRLVRVRRDWVALPEADPELVAAARSGVVLGCVTRARRLGLWVLHDGPVHVAAAPKARVRVPDGVVVHWSRPMVPRAPGVLEDPVENALVAVAACQRPEFALAVWESALQKGLVDPLAMARMPLPRSAASVLAQASPISDSGLETLFRAGLRWLKVRIIAQPRIAGHRCDFLIGERLVVQIDGGHHVGAQRTSDIAHDAQLMLLGYHVLRFSYTQIVGDWPAVQDVIVRAIAQGLHLAAA